MASHSMNTPMEVELKFIFDPLDRTKLDATPTFCGKDGQTERLISTYFDTPDCVLQAAGFSLRVRKKGKIRVQTIKADNAATAGLFVRPEWERQISSDTPFIDAESGPLSHLVGKAVPADLTPLFESDVKRTVHNSCEAKTIVECAVDEGEVRLSAGNAKVPVSELELELVEGSPRTLFNIARRINEDVPLRLSVQSKAERGYRLFTRAEAKAFRAEPIFLDPKAGIDEVFRSIAQSCLRQFRLNEELLLENAETEPVHQTRVGLRRLRSAFSLFKPLFDGDADYKRLKPEVRALSAVLGDVRNLDVLLDRVAVELRPRLSEARDTAMAHARMMLCATSSRRLMVDLTEWLAFGDWRLKPTDPALINGEATAFADALLERRRQQLKKRGRHLAALSNENRHKVRIEAKKLRYASEFFCSFYPDNKQRRHHKAFLKAMENLQNILGDLNDSVTAPLVLKNLELDSGVLGNKKRTGLLKKSESALEALIDVKPFWR
jgi:inorganic triphosphatase YgiF